MSDGASGRQEEAAASPEAPAEPRAKKNLSWSSIVKSLLAGGIAGGVSRTAVAPLERLKILMQVQGNQRVYTGTFQGLAYITNSPAPPQGLAYITRHEGLAGWFRGNWTNCVRIIPNSAVKFLMYEQLSRRIALHLQERGGEGQMTPLLRLTAGAGAGIVAMSATYPLDMVRGRLTVQCQKDEQRYRGILDATVKIVRQEGLVALWRGWLPSVIGVIPYVGLNFMVYESMKEVVLQFYDLNDERELSVATRLACGALAGTTGQTVAYPLDVVRRRMQMSGWAGAQKLHGEAGAAVKYKGMVDCFSRTLREEGVRALFKGLLPNYYKVVPSIAIAFVTYEKLKEALGVELRISS